MHQGEEDTEREVLDASDMSACRTHALKAHSTPVFTGVLLLGTCFFGYPSSTPQERHLDVQCRISIARAGPICCNGHWEKEP